MYTIILAPPIMFCRALARMGNVYYQQQQWKDAIKFFDKSLTEHRNADVLKKKQQVSDIDSK